MPLQDTRREEEIEEFFRLMRRKFTEDEWCQIRSSGSDHKTQLSVFFRLWCLKESFIKARCFCNPKIRFFSLLYLQKMFAAIFTSRAAAESNSAFVCWGYDVCHFLVS